MWEQIYVFLFFFFFFFLTEKSGGRSSIRVDEGDDLDADGVVDAV